MGERLLAKTLSAKKRRGKPIVFRAHDSAATERAHLCQEGDCKSGKKCEPSTKRTPKQVAEEAKETRAAGVCWCDVCTNDVGVEAAVHLCHFCKTIAEAHAAVGKRMLSKTVSDKERRGKQIVGSNIPGTVQRLHAEYARLCQGGNCNKAGTKCGPPTKRTRKQAAEDTKETRIRTTGVCWCDVCTDGVGVEAAVHLFHFCKPIPEAHAAMGKRKLSKRVSGKKRKGKLIGWASGKKTERMVLSLGWTG